MRLNRRLTRFVTSLVLGWTLSASGSSAATLVKSEPSDSSTFQSAIAPTEGYPLFADLFALTPHADRQIDRLSDAPDPLKIVLFCCMLGVFVGIGSQITRPSFSGDRLSKR